MKEYQLNSKNCIDVDGIGCVPTDPKNRHYAAILREVEAGTAEILPYSPPSDD